MQRQSSHAGRGVEGLGHRDENRASRLQPFDELRKVGEGTGQPVDLPLLPSQAEDAVAHLDRQQRSRCTKALKGPHFRFWSRISISEGHVCAKEASGV